MKKMNENNDWPAPWSKKGFKYDLSDPELDHNLIFGDIFYAVGNLFSGQKPPINFAEGLITCLKTLDELIKKSKKENLLEILNKITFEKVRQELSEDTTLLDTVTEIRNMITK
jgi:hypothetical protein